MGNAAAVAPVADQVSTQADQQHMAWIARAFGRADYAPLNAKDLEALIGAAQVLTTPAGTFLFREGEQASAVFLVEAGQIEVYRGTGPTRRVVSRVGPGSVLGDMAMFGGTAHVASARATTRVRAFRLERVRLLPELVRNPAI